MITWRVTESGDLEIGLTDREERAALLAQLYPPPHDSLTGREVADDALYARYLAQPAPVVRGWAAIQTELFAPLLDATGWRLVNHDSPWFPLSSNNFLVEFAPDGWTMRRVWTDPAIFFRAASGIDTLALTGICRWAKVALEE